MRSVLLIALSTGLPVAAGFSAQAQEAAPIILHQSEKLVVQGQFQGGVDFVAEHNLF